MLLRVHKITNYNFLEINIFACTRINIIYTYLGQNEYNNNVRSIYMERKKMYYMVHIIEYVRNVRSGAFEDIWRGRYYYLTPTAIYVLIKIFHMDIANSMKRDYCSQVYRHI